MNVIEALGHVMGDVQAVGKHERNKHFGFNFRGIDAVVNAVGPALRKHGVVIAPTATVHTAQKTQTGRGKPTTQTVLTVTFTVWGPEGDSIDVQVSGESMDEGDKGTAKAHSVAYRIALLQLLCIPTDEPDPDSVAYVMDPEPVRADDATIDGLREKIERLPAADQNALKNWFRDNLSTPLGRLSVDDAEKLGAHLDGLLEDVQTAEVVDGGGPS